MNKRNIVNRCLNSRAYSKAEKTVSSLVNTPDALLALLNKASRKTNAHKTGPLSKIVDSVKVLVRLAFSYARGDYRNIAYEKLALVIAALVYFVMPIDALPDFIAGFGLTDDAALLAWTWSAVRDEVEQFLLWEAESNDNDLPTK